MERYETVTLTNMCMIEDSNGRILVQDKKNSSWGGICFPGGHVEKNEAFASSVIREIKEETGLDISGPKLCGIKQFCDTENQSRYIVLLYKTNEFSGELVSSSEGDVFWVSKLELQQMKLAPRFEDMLKVFESDDVNEVYYFRSDGELQTQFF